ncbi:MAG TPA: PorV/PorQ family protein [Gemmatimonadales bacterium]|nr:PorV/PorQ family protein [Gemmatimonadales bacterium]
MGRFRGALACLLLCAHPAVCLTAQNQPVNAAALFLLLPISARSVGMGQTAAALDGHGEDVFLNPAGVGSMTSSEFALHSARLAAGPATALTAFFPRRGIGVFGAAVYLLDFGDEPLLDSNNVLLGQFGSRNLAFLTTYATQLSGSVSLGVSYKLIEFRVDCAGPCPSLAGQGVTHALDLGGQFSVGPDHALRVGVALRNLGFALQVKNEAQADPLPTRLAFGAAYTVQLRPMGDDPAGNRFDLQVVADVESPWRETGTPDVRVGMDLGYQQVVRVRGGYAYRHEGLSGPSIGLGVATGVIGVDLAQMFLTHTDLVVSNPTFLSFRVLF